MAAAILLAASAAGLLLWRARRRGLAVFRPLTAADFGDVVEMASHTYGGHDWIMSEFAGWIVSPVSLTLGIQLGQRVRAIENLRLVDGGRTGWLEALRVHPCARRRGFAAKLQRRLIAQSRLVFPNVERFRYTTAAFNSASLSLAAACGLRPVHRWGFVVMSADAPKADKDAVPSTSSISVTSMSPAEFAAGLRAELGRATAGAVAGGAAVVPCSAADVLSMEARGGSSASKVGLIFDWKVETLCEEALGALLAAKACSAAKLAGASSSSYTLGKTRPDFDGEMRVYHAVAIGASESERYRDYLRLAIHEAEAACRDGARSMMGFFDLEFQDKLVAAGLAERYNVSVLLERNLAAAQ